MGKDQRSRVKAKVFSSRLKRELMRSQERSPGEEPRRGGGDMSEYRRKDFEFTLLLQKKKKEGFSARALEDWK